MAQDEFKPKLGRIRDAASNAQLRTNTQVLRETGRSGARAVRQRGHITSAMPKRGMGTGVRAAAGLIAPGSRRVIVKARYTRISAGDMGAARAPTRPVSLSICVLVRSCALLAVSRMRPIFGLKSS